MAGRVGQQFGNYQLVALLGQGSFAEVYLGQHVRLNLQAAIKVLHTHLTEQEVEHFQQEAQTIARLAHPSIVRILDYDVQDGIPFLVMDYAPGGSLRRRYPKGTLVPLPQILSLVKQVAAGLQYAHEQKVIHRDVKPENMLLGRQEEVLLSDFGIAIVAHSTASLSIQAAVGTIPYMAPEQIQGHPRPASDQYALAVTVYEWLCGQRPFSGSFTELVMKHLWQSPSPLPGRASIIPPEVEQVVLRALTKDPKARFSTVRDFATALEQASQPALSPTAHQALEQPARCPAAAPGYDTVAPDHPALPAESLPEASLPTEAPEPTVHPGSSAPNGLDTLERGAVAEMPQPDHSTAPPGAVLPSPLEPTLPVARTASSGKREPEAEGERPWNVPYARNPFFTGRAQLLERLHAQLSHSHHAAFTQSYALNGLGGIGKTQAAIEYAYRYRQAYSAVFWVHADSRETLIADFVAIARLLGLPGQDAPEQLQIVAAVKRWLEQHEGWLLILDNADELSLLSDFLPAAGHGQLLLTTRAQATGKIAQSLSVEKMEVFEGMQLLLRRAKLLGPGELLDDLSAAMRTAAQQLVQELDGLPLALDQAGAYVEETSCSLSEYLQLYGQRRLALLKRQSIVSADYPHTVASTWSLSFERAEQASPAAADLLRLCAFLHPDAISETIIHEGAGELGPVLSQVGGDPLLLNETIQVLRRYSLIKRDPEAKILVIHRLVQVVLKESLDAQAQQQWAERAVRAVNRAFPEVEFTRWQHCQQLLPHAQVCARLIEQWDMNFPEAAQLLHRAGSYLQARGQYQEAEPLLQQALAIYERTLEPDHPDVATSLHDLATLYWEQGKYAQAEPLFQQALDIREKTLGLKHPDVAISLNDLALVYWDWGKYAQAEPLFQRALAIREQILGPEHADVAQGLNNLAILYWEQGKYAQAEALYQRALAIWEQALGPNHPEVASGLNNLAMVYQSLAEYEQAEPLFRRALAIWEQALGPEHDLVALVLDNLALGYIDQGKYAQAEPFFQQALAIREQKLGPEHPYVGRTLQRLAKLYYAQGKYTQAEPLLTRSLVIRERALGAHHPDVAYSLDTLALLSLAQSRYTQAEQLGQRALAIREQALGKEHPHVAESLSTLALVYCAQGRYKQAEPLFGRALHIREQALGPEHPQTATVLDAQGYLLLLQGRKEQAETLLQHALAIREQALGNAHPDVARTLHHLAELSEKQGKDEQARSLYQRALVICKQALGPEHPDTVKVREHSSELLHAMQEKGGHRRPAGGHAPGRDTPHGNG